MKRHLLLLLFFAQISLATMAQTERGVGWWSGGLGIQRGRTDLFQDVSEANALDASLTQGMFVKEDVLLGATIGLTRTRNYAREGFNFDALTDDRQTDLALTPFVRHFFGSRALRGYVGGGVAVQYGRDRLLTANTRQRESETEVVRWRVRPEVQAGAFYVINRRWGIDLSTRSSVVPLAFTDLRLGLVVLTDVKQFRPAVSNQRQPQLLAGNWLISGSFEAGEQRRRLTSAAGEPTSNQQERRIEQYRVSPSVGYFPGGGWLVGVSVPLSREQQSNTFLQAAQTVTNTAGSYTTDAIGVAPFVKKYFVQEQFGPFLGARFGWHREHTYGERVFETNATTYTWRVSGGLAYLLGSHFIVEGELAGIGNERSFTEQTGGASRQFRLDATLRPTFTMSYVFL